MLLAYEKVGKNEILHHEITLYHVQSHVSELSECVGFNYVLRGIVVYDCCHPAAKDGWYIKCY